MRVLIITDTFPPEKVGSYRMYDLAANFSKDGFEVTVLCPPPTFPFGSFKRTWKLATVEFLKGMKIVHLWTWQPQSSALSKLSRGAYYFIMPMFAAIWTLCNSNFDVVITSSGSSPLIWLPGLLAKKLRSKPLIVDVRDLPVDSAVSLGFLEKDSLPTKLLRNFEFMCYLSSDFVLVPTESVMKGILSYCIRKDKVVIIPNAADIEIFYPCSVSKKRQIIYAGNIGYAQDFECVLSAMREISKQGIRLLMVGEGEVRECLQKQVRENHLDAYITFMGGMERSQLPQLLSESIAGLAPLKKLKIIEGSIPAKIFDYMACAIPFIAFGGSDLERISADSSSGFVIDNDPHNLCEIVVYLAKNPLVAKDMGLKGRAYCEKYYNRRAMAAKIELLMFRLCDNSDSNYIPNVLAN